MTLTFAIFRFPNDHNRIPNIRWPKNVEQSCIRRACMLKSSSLTKVSIRILEPDEGDDLPAIVSYTMSSKQYDALLAACLIDRSAESASQSISTRDIDSPRERVEIDI